MGLLGAFQTPNFSWAEPNWNQGRAKLPRPAELIHTSILIQAERNSKEKNVHFGKSACKIRDNNICIRFGRWKVHRLNQTFQSNNNK